MYLVSIYFDSITDQKIREIIGQIAKNSQNKAMLDGNIPPHITISAFESRQELQKEKQIISLLDAPFSKLERQSLQWVSVGAFFPHVLYLMPVLNSYLHNISLTVSQHLQTIEDLSIRPYYQPFHWLPHTTVAKNLSTQEMLRAFETLQKSFGMFSGKVIKIGLSKTNPYHDIQIWELKC